MARPAGRALVRRMSPTAAPADEVELVLDARPAFDFLVSLMMDTEPELLPDDAAWLADARGSLSEAVRRDVSRAFENDETGAGLGLGLVELVMADPSVRTSSDVVALANRIGIEDLVGHLCETGAIEDPEDLARAALAGDATARERLTSAAGDWTRPTVARALDDPEGELRAMRRALRAWHETFMAVESRVAAMAERDVDLRRHEAATLPLVEFVEKATGGVRWTREPGVRRLAMVPSYFARPYNYLFGDHASRVICYPLGDAALDGDTSALPSATVRLFKALGDESRLRILRLLADGDLYLTEIAERMSLSKPTVKHHMVLLRAAGLVAVTETGGLTYYSLRRDRLADASGDLQRLVGA
ncbi:MAG: metalloregulator ArsR/SmtB family transcription factor [Chloroflexi bacterium]|nr:metalloregulator ArsR/SmtB family transcription factor [Chloroflexota bacterium]